MFIDVCFENFELILYRNIACSDQQTSGFLHLQDQISSYFEWPQIFYMLRQLHFLSLIRLCKKFTLE
jgi:hypothetical protein